MFRTLTSSQARAVEERAAAEGTAVRSLMDTAGLKVALEAADRVPEGEVLVLAGPGNNGGDGWVAARELHAMGRAVRVLSVRAPAGLSGVAGAAAQEAIAAGVAWEIPFVPPTPEDLSRASVVVDALLGTGASGRLRPPLGEWVRAINASGAFVLAVDVPTGVDSDSGEAAEDAVRADVTVTFSAPKLGLVLHPGAVFAGEIVVADVGAGILAPEPGVPEVWSPEDYARLLPLPADDAHKDSRGRLLVVAGSSVFPGAAILATRGAMRSGAGYVRLAVPRSTVAAAQCHLLAAPVAALPEDEGGTLSAAAAAEVLRLAENADAVLIGPGLTVAEGAVAAVREIVGRLDKPLVIDADALNALAETPGLIRSRRASTVLTPHPGELGRLLAASTQQVQSDRLFSASVFAGPSCVVVLKGAGTVVSGAGRQVVNTSGSPALATAGTGDVLGGVIGALLAQGLAPLEAAALGVYVHGRAGEAAACDLTPVCVIAEDIPAYLPVAVADLLEVRTG